MSSITFVIESGLSLSQGILICRKFLTKLSILLSFIMKYLLSRVDGAVSPSL